MTTDAPESRRIRFRLRTLLLMVTLIGIVAGWLADRARLTERLRQSQVENRLKQDQLDALQQQLAVQYGSIQTVYWWANSDEFIEMLRTVSSDQKFLEMAPSLAQSEGKVFESSIEKLNVLLNAPEKRTRSRALNTLRFMHELAPGRIADSLPSIVKHIIPLLDESSTSNVGEAIGTVQSFGPAAKDAIDSLKTRMSDDSDWYAPDAAVAVASIDPSIDIGPRLSALIRAKHPNWYQAAFHLPRHIDPETARRVLTKAYDDAADDGERNMATQAMNQIPPKTEP